MLAFRIWDGSVSSACPTHATFQMLNRPSLVSSRPTVVGRVRVGAVRTMTRTLPTATARSSGRRSGLIMRKTVRSFKDGRQDPDAQEPAIGGSLDDGWHEAAVA